jgi:hypothetical protein
VTFTKKITASSTAQLDEKCKVWLISEEGKAITGAVDHVGVDPTWEQYLAQADR